MFSDAAVRLKPLCVINSFLSNAAVVARTMYKRSSGGELWESPLTRPSISITLSGTNAFTDV